MRHRIHRVRLQCTSGATATHFLCAIALLAATSLLQEVTTPTQATFVGCEFERELCGVSIVRAGESMEHALRSVEASCLRAAHDPSQLKLRYPQRQRTLNLAPLPSSANAAARARADTCWKAFVSARS